jgi:hypothetical protein
MKIVTSELKKQFRYSLQVIVSLFQTFRINQISASIKVRIFKVLNFVIVLWNVYKRTTDLSQKSLCQNILSLRRMITFRLGDEVR